MKIFLIGFMGCGKTTTGKILAKKLSHRFIDLDEEIERSANKTIDDIFTNQGEDAFRKIEYEKLKEINLLNDIVVATGGGTPCFHENLNIMKKKGTTIYLKSSAEILIKRLSILKKKRPLIKNINSEELFIFIKSKLQERETFYNKASITIETKNFTPEQIVDLIYSHYATKTDS